ncbi:MAG: sensor domain-containing diguanylate cyclase [Candidatus Dormibacteria bacterium]
MDASIRGLAARRPRRRPAQDAPSRWKPTAVALVVLVLTVSALAAGLAATQEQSRRDLRQTFGNRADLSSSFASAYVAEVLAREKTNAQARLGGTVSRAQFEEVSGVMGFEAAVLLDSQGHVLQVVPSNPAVVGKAITATYPHLAAAEAGRSAVSVVVPGAATGNPIVAFAVPFDSASGRRVFSGGFDVRTTPLGSYLRNSLPFPGATSDLVDSAGKLVATSRTRPVSTLLQADAGLARAVKGSASDSIGGPSDRRHFVTSHPAGTPWTLVNTVPEAALYSPLSTAAQLIPWVVLAGLLGVGLYAVVLVRRLSDSRRVLAMSSNTDALTGLANRRSFDRTLAHELARSARTERPICVAMLDIDHFKRFNDTRGHGAGDALLKAAATAWTGAIRDSDLLARYGGEEFVVLMPDCPAAEAPHVAERIRRLTPGEATISVGIAQWDTTETATQLLARADAALYRAKRAGRDRVAAA